jgi:DNA-binding NarL/FixJ family response regulator
MSTVFVARRHPSQARATQARLQASQHLQVLGVAETLFRTRDGLKRTQPDLLLIDLRLEDGAALSLVRELRERGSDRPRVMLCAEHADDPLLFSTLVAGADAYVLDADGAPVVAAIERLAVGGAAMAPAVAAQALAFFNEVQRTRAAAPATDDRHLDWSTHAANPMRLSPGECRLLQLLAGGATSSEVAARSGQSLESIGRRIGNIYRKLSWDVRSGSLALLAA